MLSTRAATRLKWGTQALSLCLLFVSAGCFGAATPTSVVNPLSHTATADSDLDGYPLSHTAPSPPASPPSAGEMREGLPV